MTTFILIHTCKGTEVYIASDGLTVCFIRGHEYVTLNHRNSIQSFVNFWSNETPSFIRHNRIEEIFSHA